METGLNMGGKKICKSDSDRFGYGSPECVKILNTLNVKEINSDIFLKNDI